MEEREMNIKELFAFINNYEGEIFARVMFTEEGEFYGEQAECSSDSIDQGETSYE